MELQKDFITPNEWSRPGYRMREVLGIVMHWTANPMIGAKTTRDFLDAKKTGMGSYGSAHYVIGQDGRIVQCIPEEEIAYHTGSGKADPASGQIYTDYARKKFRHYAVHYQSTSPNFCTIGIELCPTDWDGHFTAETTEAAVELCVDICGRYGLTAEDITTHHDIVGWKDCPRLWTAHPELLDAFKASVADSMQRGKHD